MYIGVGGRNAFRLLFFAPKMTLCEIDGGAQITDLSKKVEGNVLNMTWIVRLIEKIKIRHYYEKEF